MLKPKGPYCQSCGMPLSKDEKGGGTKANGTLSKEYCSHCYQQGAFTDPNITFDQMKANVQKKMKEMHLPFFFVKAFTKDMASLRRWSQ